MQRLQLEADSYPVVCSFNVSADSFGPWSPIGTPFLGGQGLSLKARIVAICACLYDIALRMGGAVQIPPFSDRGVPGLRLLPLPPLGARWAALPPGPFWASLGPYLHIFPFKIKCLIDPGPHPLRALALCFLVQAVVGACFMLLNSAFCWPLKNKKKWFMRP